MSGLGAISGPVEDQVKEPGSASFRAVPESPHGRRAGRQGGHADGQ